MLFIGVSVFAVGILVASSARITQDVRGNFGSKKYLVIPVEQINEEVYAIFEDYHVDQVGHSIDELHLIVPSELKLALLKEGVVFTDQSELFLRNTERNLASEDFVCLDDARSCAQSSLETFHSQYQTLDSIHARFEIINNENPSKTKLENFGTTFEGRNSKILWIDQDITASEEKPLIFYFCAIHAREWITPMFCTYMAEMLTDSNNDVAKDLISKFTFAIVPVANPDGYVYSFEVDNAWRKTRKPNVNSTCVGADANRNYEVFHGGPGSSPNPCSDTHSGAEPFDQPCVASIKAFTDKYMARLVHINDVHSYGKFFLSPYAGSEDLPPDSEKHEECSEAVFDAINEESGSRFTTGTFARALYIASGVSNDYFYFVNGITHSYTFEATGGGQLGLGGFQPPVSNIIESNRELYAGFISLANCVYNQEILLIPPFTQGGSDVESDSTESSTISLGGLLIGLLCVALGFGLIAGVVFLIAQRYAKTGEAKEEPKNESRVSTKNPMMEDQEVI